MLDSEVYNKAADMVESGWTQNAYARDSQEKPTYPCRNNAESWCLSGALIAAVYNLRGGVYYSSDDAEKAFKLSEDLGLPCGDTAEWNDNPDRTKEQVVDLLRDAATQSLLSEGE